MNFIFSANFPYKYFTTTKSAGDMKNKAERDSFLRSMALNPVDLVLANQVHGNNAKVVKRSDQNTFIDNCDGLITDDKNLLLGIFLPLIAFLFLFLLAMVNLRLRCMLIGKDFIWE
jgi:copper oxidase (laccase) domain-containing protein